MMRLVTNLNVLGFQPYQQTKTIPSVCGKLLIYSLWTKIGIPRSLNDINSKCIPVISTAKCSRTAIIYKLSDAFMLWFLLLIISYNLIFFRLWHDIFSLKKNLVVTSISKSNKILHPFWHKFYNSSIIYLLICMYITVYIYLYDIYLGKKIIS